ncbi:cysteine hydrolase family protein [Gracilimonas sediminicola]|uniref:Cysteine hydrolase n=1 Tax=Gracilimonas sediminicola TaxID=2952158 RepID=A0A9X2L417_9BACT|nr:cysteine hydrolase family protein [Gracilimonas sediminicola]MCP9291975.1 cysteine hydrolase [Gracilimonas sediminicola]
MAKDTALIVVDMQVGVFNEATIPAVFESEKLLSNVSRLIEKARNAVIPIVFIQHNGGKGHPLEQGTNDWQIHPGLDITNDDFTVQKHTPDSFYDTNLKGILDSNKISRVIIAGIQTEYCIDTICRRAFSLGYDVTLVKDSHSTWNTDDLTASQIIEHHNSLLNEWFVSLKAENEIEFSHF